MMQMMHNPYVYTLKKYIFEMLQENYPKYEEVLTRCTTTLTTKQDVEQFAQLAAQLYEAGFKRCLEEHKQKLAELGISFSVGMPKQQGEPIFPPETQEKSG